MAKMPAQLLFLSWKDHNGVLVSGLENLLLKNTLVDCTLAAEGQYLKAHRVVLSACSPYFELLFSQESDKNPIVILKDVKFEELKAAVSFMYRGEVEVHEDRIQEFLEVANSLQIKGLESGEKLQDLKEQVLPEKSSSAKSALTHRQQFRIEDSNSQSENVGQSSNVPADSEEVRNDESSCVSKTNSETDTLSVAQSYEEIGFGNSTDVTVVDEQVDLDEPNIKTMDAVTTSPQKGCPTEETKTADRVCEKVDGMHLDNRSSLEDSSISHVGMDTLLSEDNLHPSPAPVQFYSTESGSTQNNNTEKSTNASLPRTTPDPSPLKLICPSCKAFFVSNIDFKKHQDTPCCNTLPGVSVAKISPNDSCLPQSNTLRKCWVSLNRISYNCSECKYVTLRPHDLMAHVRIHKGGKRFKCPHCVYMPRTKRHLVEHLRTQTGENPYKCQYCHYACKTRGNLIRHLKIHPRNKPFKCQHCHHVFKRRSSLVKHLRIHADENLFKCQLCDYTCRYRIGLKQHTLKHTGENLYTCQECDYVCRQKSNFVRHLRKHTGEKPFKCHHCEFTCSFKNNLARHIQTHMGEHKIKSPKMGLDAVRKVI